MAWNEIRHRAKLVKDFKDVPFAEGNESRLGQVFLNLIVNATQAIAEGHAEENEIRVTLSQDGTGRIGVAVTDTGSGMPAEVQKRLFTPFFTTKPPGVGTGLGLSICHKIVASMGGRIEVDSEVGRGTTFWVWLRAATEGTVDRIPSTPPRPKAVRRGRILAVDDEPMILTALRKILSAEHEVFIAHNGAEALAELRRGERYDVILCDLMMPELTGMDLHEELVRTAPDQARAMVFMTGGAFTARARQFMEEVPNVRVEKPFDADALLAVIDAQVSKITVP
jgi:CheY-like chemotaxis protein